MHVYSHAIVNDYFHVCNDALLPAFWSVDDTPIMSANTHDATAPSISHDRECTVASVFPKERLGILLSPAYRYIAVSYTHLTLPTIYSV